MGQPQDPDQLIPQPPERYCLPRLGVWLQRHRFCEFFAIARHQAYDMRVDFRRATRRCKLGRRLAFRVHFHDFERLSGGNRYGVNGVH